MTRLAVFSDVHGNLPALEAVRAAIAAEAPDVIVVAGDVVLNGPDPVGVVDALRDLESAGAYIIQGNTDVAVADFDFAAAFPWLDTVPEAQRVAAEWAHEQLSDEQRDYLSNRRQLLGTASKA